ncbi:MULTISPECIES: WXG100-like domain-containing protein [Streptosporangium]|uniref:Outer membrane channel protein CpnT-like N-terminal domain-containing protein n=1 Tax=Streptosporangium brasiliense TaxID=47480 RepID=A0ABT9R875_9ACTN|nr:hypothetical protein [Streptosporangium brasiliense]MDP9865437.1 hypothetical protein [Streptosporangium brasiliense]
MGFDGFLVPDWVKPWVGWVVGTDWPEGDESGCFRLADACAATARSVAEGGPHGGPGTMRAARPDSDWDGTALRAFADHVRQVSGGKQAELVDRLVAAALEFNRVGVNVEYTKRMIEVSVWLLIFQIVWLLAAAAGPWGGVSLALIGARAQLARMTVRQIAIRLMINIGLFGGLMAGMDLGVQASQSRRDEIDWRQVLASGGTGALAGAFLTGMSGGLSRLATGGLQAGLSRAEMSALEKLLVASGRSMWGLMGQSGLANGAATAVSLGLSGHFDWEMVLKGTTAGVVGGADAHWTGASPSWHGKDGGTGGEGPRGGPEPQRGGSDVPPGPDGPAGGRPMGTEVDPTALPGGAHDSAGQARETVGPGREPVGESVTELAHAVPAGTARPEVGRPEGGRPEGGPPRADGPSPHPAGLPHQAPTRPGGETGPGQAAPGATGGRSGAAPADGAPGPARSTIDRLINWGDYLADEPAARPQDAPAPHRGEAAGRSEGEGPEDGGAAGRSEGEGPEGEGPEGEGSDTRDAVMSDTGDGGQNHAAEQPSLSPEQLRELADVQAEGQQILSDRFGDSAPTVDYTSVPIHPDVAREYNRVLSELADRFPAVMSEVGTVSTGDPMNRFTQPVGGYSVLSGPDKGIYLNPRYLHDPGQVADLYGARMRAGWLSLGYEDLGAVLHHEFGHHLVSHMPYSVERALMQAVREVIGARVGLDTPFLPHTAEKVEGALSRYGASDPHEMIAEAFAEYMGAGTPRLLALAIGQILESYHMGGR